MLVVRRLGPRIERVRFRVWGLRFFLGGGSMRFPNESQERFNQKRECKGHARLKL